MIQITPQMRILLAVEPVDFRRGIDGLSRLCRESLSADPLGGTAFVFRNKRGSALRVLVVLLPDSEDGNVGRIVVSNQAGSTELSTAWASTRRCASAASASGSVS